MQSEKESARGHGMHSALLILSSL